MRVATLLVLAAVIAAIASNCSSSKTDDGGSPDSLVPRLVERIDKYYTHLLVGEYSDAYAMLASKWRKGGRDEEDWISYVSRMAQGVKISEWSIHTLSLNGNRARAEIQEIVVLAENPTQSEAVTEAQFWQYENGNWFYIPVQLSDWDEARAERVDLRRSP